MYYIDTHAHLFDSAFDADRESIVGEAVENGVLKMILPAIDSASHEKLISTVRQYPDYCFAAMGLHPTSVNEMQDYGKELETVRQYLDVRPVPFVAVGEIGLDLYWRRDRLEEQTAALHYQIELALEHSLPVILHTRDAFDEMFRILKQYAGSSLRGVFHGFSGTVDDYHTITEIGGFLCGIGGTVTYKNCPLAETVRLMDLNDIVLETDAPYLTPVPYRGKRNKSAYIPLIAGKISELKNIPIETVASLTSENAKTLFGI